MTTFFTILGIFCVWFGVKEELKWRKQRRLNDEFLLVDLDPVQRHLLDINQERKIEM